MPRRTPRRRHGDHGDTTGRPPAPRRHPDKTMGRLPFVYDDDTVGRLLTAIGAGVPIRAACDHAGIHYATHARAMDQGKQADDQQNTPREDGRDPEPLTERQQAYRDYRDHVLRARAGAGVAHVHLINKAAKGGQLLSRTVRTYTDDEGKEIREVTETYAKGSWLASKFMVQALMRDDFTPTSNRNVQVTGGGGGPVQVQQSADVLSAVLTRIRSVAEENRGQLPGGWDPPEDGDEDFDPDDPSGGGEHEVWEGEIVDRELEGDR